MLQVCNTVIMSKFDEWLRRELELRGWLAAEFSKRSGLSRSQVSRVLNNQVSPGEVFCIKTAAALALPPARVFRLAGLIPSYSIPDEWVMRTMESLYTFTPTQRDIVDSIINMILLTNSIKK